MQKIKIMTDSTSDIDPELEESLGIKILCFTVIVDGKAYRERQDFSAEEFYRMMDNAVEFPTTAQLTPFELQEAYQEQFEAGYTDLIYVTIASNGSATHQNAIMARENFYSEVQGSERMKIHIVDSKNYTGAYGYPVMQAATKAQKGVSCAEILDYLNEWFECTQVIFAPLTLKYAKRSGRISVAAAFAGELLGLRPVLRISDGKFKIEEKVRGDKNLVPKILQMTMASMIPKTPYALVAGSNPAYAEELGRELTKKLGYPPAHIFRIGATVSCNAGPDVVGTIIRAERRSHSI